MRELPTGTVTFLFTDIEGSTRLLHEHNVRRDLRQEMLGVAQLTLDEATALALAATADLD